VTEKGKQSMSETEAPERSETEAPERSETEAPERSETEAPERSETEAPERSETEAPERSETEALQKRFAAALMPNYGVPPLAISRGQGCRVWDADGNQYLDLIAGIAVSSLGHAHPAIVEAVSRQVAEVAHTSNLFLHEREVELAERLLCLLGGTTPPDPPATGGIPSPQDPPGPPVPPGGRVFFANSGTEANEAAVKLVRRIAGPERPVIVAAEHSFHGRTMGALALTGKESIRAPFGPFGLTVRFVPYGDAGVLREAVGADVAAVFLEPGLGESGVVPAPEGYLRAAREACDAAGALLVLDEIQSGIGRTGVWFAHQAAGVRPDVLTLAKGLGGGLPIGACIGLGAAGAGFAKGDHGSTFGGNPVACAAALAVLEVIERDGLLAHVNSVGEHLAAGLGEVSHPLVSGVRGLGLWRAIVLTAEVAPDVEAAARRAGFLVNAVQPDAIRLAPPLILSAAQADEFIAALPGILAEVSS
jgi:acetylornithine/N-succinyldiaminopimelate aminotransferase